MFKVLKYKELGWLEKGALPKVIGTSFCRAWIVLIFFKGSLIAQSQAQIEIPPSVEQLFIHHCYACHDADSEKGDLNLEELPMVISHENEAHHWQDVLDNLNAGEMPPKDKKQPQKQELMEAIGDLTDALQEARKQLRDNGRVSVMRRLNKREYVATIKELMGVRIDPLYVPDDHVGGIDTVGATQNFYARHLEAYYELAQKIVQMSFDWARKPRQEPQVTRLEGERGFGKAKKIAFYLERLLAMKENGKSYEEMGIPKAYQNLLTKSTGQKINRARLEYMKRQDPEVLKKGLLVSNVDGVDKLSLRVPRDARGWYKIRLQAGVVGEPHIRRYARIALKGELRGGQDSRHIDVLRLSGSIESPESKSTIYTPAYEPGLGADESSYDVIEFREDWAKQKPNTDAFKAHQRRVEPEGAQEVIFFDWVEAEGPYYDPKSPFERLVETLGPLNQQASLVREAGLDSKAHFFIKAFALEAYRQRSLPKDLSLKLHQLYLSNREQGLDFYQAMVEPLAIILSTPAFLYLQEPAKTEEETLDAISFTNRLSYFLWSSPPDQPLLQTARRGGLDIPEQLEREVTRMLADPKAENFYKGFVEQWLHLKRFDEINLSFARHPLFSPGLKHSARLEPQYFFQQLVRENLSLNQWIDSDFVMVNGILARHYGLDNHRGVGFQKVSLSDKAKRGGLLGQMAFLTMGTMGDRSSPVIRGALVRDFILNDPAAPPPPNVPELDLSKEAGALPSVRTLVELHQKKSQCAACHSKMDQIGLGIENYDAIGMWRELEVVRGKKNSEKTYPIDSSGVLPDGQSFSDLEELKEILLKNERQLASSILEKLLTYALGRELSFLDLESFDSILDDLENSKGQNYRARSMIQSVVASDLFKQP